MRGKGYLRYVKAGDTGITPAYAGKSSPAFLSQASDRGSPPPMRGKVVDIVYQLQQEGITPAYAGKRLWCCIHQKLRWDHPRLCGEKFGGWDASIRALGSPPPMRGKAFKAACATPTDRITPAYAGKRVFAVC